MSFNCWNILVLNKGTISSQVLYLVLIRKEFFMYTYNCTRCHKPFDSEVEIISNKVRCPRCEEIVRIANEKRRKTTLERYGTENVAQNTEIKNKFVNTWKERYGCMGYFQRGCDQNEIQRLAHSDIAYERKKLKNNKKLGVDWPAQSKAIQDKMKSTYFERTGYENAMQNPEDRYKCRTGKYDYKGINFDSSWELAFYIWLEDNDKQFIYHPHITVDYVDDYGVSRKYYPDFIVEGRFYEVKGDQFFNEKGEPFDSYTNETWNNKYQLLKDNNVTILKMSDIKKYLKYIKEKYGKNYLNSFKKKYKKGSETIESLRE